MANPKVRLLMLLTLTWLSTWYVTSKLIVPNLEARIAFTKLSLEGQNEPPYRYRLFEPVVNKIIQDTLLSTIANVELQHIISYVLFSFTTFAVLYVLLFRYLSQLFDPTTALLGLVLFQIVIPLSITGSYMEGDFVTVVIYLAALNLMFSKQDRWLPLVLLVGAFVREQTIFILVLYLIYHFANHTLHKQTMLILGMSILFYGAVFVGLRVALGTVPTHYTPAFHIQENLNPRWLIGYTIPLWLGEVLGFVALATASYRTSNRFFQLALMSLVAYVGLFFFNGLLYELGKFLPAYLILIPMSLQVVTGHHMETSAFSA